MSEDTWQNLPKGKTNNMSKLKLKLHIFEHGEFKLPSKKKMKKWVKAAIERDTELNVMFVGEEEGREMNAQYRHKDYATNVLTFDYQHEPVAIADLVICVPVLIKEAKNQNKSFDEHLAHLLIHGTLHAHGYDHMEYNEANVMEDKEIGALLELGFDNPYEDRILLTGKKKKLRFKH